MEKRLQSLKLPRDLSLGGTKLPKKAYAPNLNVVRNKDKAKDIVKKTEQKRKEKYDRKNNKNNDKNQRYVQSNGVFSEGAGADLIRKYLHRESYGSKDNTPVTMAMPTVKKDSWQVDKKNEESVFEEIMDNEGYGSEEEDKLAFAPVNWDDSVFKEDKSNINMKIKSEIKSEFPDPQLKTLQSEISCLNIIPNEYYTSEEASDYNPVLNLWSMPDSFGGKGLSDDPNIKQLFDYKLSDMLEGQIGKMLIRKSGKIEIYIGRIKYELDSTDLETFREEIVEVDVNEKESAAVVLGEIGNRFKLNPVWHELLKEA